MNGKTKKSLNKLICAGLSIFFIIASAKATIVNSNFIVQDGIEYYIQTDKAVYYLGENVEILYRLTNLTDNPVSIGEVLLFGPYYDVIITDNGDNKVWRYLLTLPPPPVVMPYFKMFDLEPYESKEFQTAWGLTNDNGTSDQTDDSHVDPGIYKITGELFLTFPYLDKKVPVTLDIEIIPEPCSLSLLAAGLMAVFSYRKRKKS
jgi:hypothetical protein